MVFVYVRDGFLICYDEDDLEKGMTFKASLSAIFSQSNNTDLPTTFSAEEIKMAIHKFNSDQSRPYNASDPQYKFPTSAHFFKSSNSTRWDRAFYFILCARSAAILPMRIAFYCTSLECLFSTSNSEVIHRVSERVALFLGGQLKREKNCIVL